MAQCYRSTPWVHLVPVQVQLVSTVDRHGSESLIDLHHVYVILQVQTKLLQKLGYGQRRPDAHDPGRETCQRCRNVLAKDGLAKFERFGPLHQQQCGRTIGDLAGVSSSASIAVLLEGTWELRYLIVGSAWMK